MEKHPGIPNKIDIFPRIMRVARFLRRCVGYLPEDAPDYMSEHYEAEIAPESAREAEIYQLRIPYDDMGDYHNPDGNSNGAA